MRMNSARVRRAMVVHDVSPMMSITFARERFAMAAMVMMRIIWGRETRISIVLEMMVSIGMLTFVVRKGSFPMYFPAFWKRIMVMVKMIKLSITCKKKLPGDVANASSSV